ncbi:alpha/beta fold hydrolase [Paractinoplanes ferrugineus]|uniref:Thioesterase n=1 Tax=Paractinoplanes ferrugineus TaxID=113564 RepID=A0A919J9Y5_9ACTN|nr:alpha/beta fold hydrolase [Actinoplanes ferrugineus]GIE16229.1 thioesterase [Actinoplanes ferrugineus]
MQLFCLPYAGGSAATYRRWTTLLPATIEMYAVELPGRGTRRRANPITDFPAMVAWVVEEMAHHHRGGPYAVFGHSFGALIAFEAARAARHRLGEPAHLLVSGRDAPAHPTARAVHAALSDDELASAVASFGGLPPELDVYPALRSRLLGVLRADLRLLQSYRPPAGDLLDCPVTVFAGSADPLITPAGQRDWVRTTTGPAARVTVPGGHFFLHSAAFGAELRRCLRATFSSPLTAAA